MIAEIQISCKILSHPAPEEEDAVRATSEASSSVSLVAQATNRLRFDILRADLEPGTKLRLEALCERYGLSSSPLREALNRLAADGLVEVEDWRGFRVKHASIDELNDITRLRLLLEREALKLAMAVGDDNWEAAIIAAFHRMQLAHGRLSGPALVLDDVWSERHREFHQALIAACGSPHLIALCGNYFLRAERYRHLSARRRKMTQNVGDSHRRLMEVVLARRKTQALDMLAEHIEGTSRRVIDVLAGSAFDGERTVPAKGDRKRRAGAN
jgi:DNA-binding GntR family transcriptional regulator